MGRDAEQLERRESPRLPRQRSHTSAPRLPPAAERRHSTHQMAAASSQDAATPNPSVLPDGLLKARAVVDRGRSRSKSEARSPSPTQSTALGVSAEAAGRSWGGDPSKCAKARAMLGIPDKKEELAFSRRTLASCVAPRGLRATAHGDMHGDIDEKELARGGPARGGPSASNSGDIAAGDEAAAKLDEVLVLVDQGLVKREVYDALVKESEKAWALREQAGGLGASTLGEVTDDAAGEEEAAKMDEVLALVDRGLVKREVYDALVKESEKAWTLREQRATSDKGGGGMQERRVNAVSKTVPKMSQRDRAYSTKMSRLLGVSSKARTIVGGVSDPNAGALASAKGKLEKGVITRAEYESIVERHESWDKGRRGTDDADRVRRVKKASSSPPRLGDVKGAALGSRHDDVRESVPRLSLYFWPGTTPPWVNAQSGRSSNPPSPLRLDGKFHASSPSSSSDGVDGVSHISPGERSLNGGVAHATSNVPATATATAETGAEPTNSSLWDHMASSDRNNGSRVAQKTVSTVGNETNRTPRRRRSLQTHTTWVSSMRPQPGLEYATLPVWAAALLVTAACVVAGLVWGRLIYFASTGYCQDEVWKHHCVQPTYPVLWGLTYRDLRPGGQTTCTCHTVRFQRGDEYVFNKV